MDHLLEREVTASTYSAEYCIAHDHKQDGSEDESWHEITGERMYSDAEDIAVQYAETYRRVRVVRVDTVKERILISEVHPADMPEKARQDA